MQRFAVFGEGFRPQNAPGTGAESLGELELNSPAVKALHLYTGQEAWGHVVARLLQELPEMVSVPGHLIEQGHVLDNFYIPSRYPNSHPEGAPFEHSSLQSGEAVRYAREIVEFVRAQMA